MKFFSTGQNPIIESAAYPISDNDVKIVEVILESMRDGSLDDETIKILNRFLTHHTAKLVSWYGRKNKEIK